MQKMKPFQLEDHSIQTHKVACRLLCETDDRCGGHEKAVRGAGVDATCVTGVQSPEKPSVVRFTSVATTAKLVRIPHLQEH